MLSKLIRKNSWLDGVRELEDNFRYGKTQISDNMLKQLCDNKFPISNAENRLYNGFAFDLEACNVKYSEYCEPYAAGVYHFNFLYECFNGDLKKEEIAIGRSEFHVFDRENSNPVFKKIN